jgi:hypothetical protein
MKNIIQHVKNNDNIETPFANHIPIFTNQYNHESNSFFKFIQYTFYGIALISLCLTLWLSIRLRNLSKLIIIATAVHPQITSTSAMPLSSSLQSKQAIIQYYVIPSTEIYIICACALALSLILFFILCKQVLKKKAFLCKPMEFFQSSYRTTETEVLLELVAQNQYVVLHIINIPTHTSLITLQDTSLTLHAFIPNCYTSFIRINWNETKLMARLFNRQTDVTLPELINVPYTVKKLTQTIANHPDVQTNILIGQNGRYTYFPTRLTKTRYKRRQDETELQESTVSESL